MRRRHRKDRRDRKQKKIIVFGVIAFACMLSVGYAAFSSEFLISGKGTIIVPEGRLTTEDLKSLVVTNGDGLYADSYENGRYVYRGADPDNYIVLDGETYRIVSIEADNTIKVVKQYNIGCQAFDNTRNVTAGGYCQYSECNAWGSSTTTLNASGNNVTVMPRIAGDSTTYALPTNEASLNTYLNTTFLNGLSSELLNVIDTHTFNIGLLASFGRTFENSIAQESAYKWRGKIALINPTDYVRASTNSSCTSIYQYDSVSECYNNSDTHNYLFHPYEWWLLSPVDEETTAWYTWFVHRNGMLYGGMYASNMNVGNQLYGVLPSFYLSANINLSGEGTSEQPYCIASVDCTVEGTESDVGTCVD